MPSQRRAFELLRSDLREQVEIRQCIEQRQRAHLPDRQLRLEEVAALDAALKSSVCCALAGHRRDAAGATAKTILEILPAETLRQLLGARAGPGAEKDQRTATAEGVTHLAARTHRGAFHVPSPEGGTRPALTVVGVVPGRQAPPGFFYQSATEAEPGRPPRPNQHERSSTGDVRVPQDVDTSLENIVFRCATRSTLKRGAAPFRQGVDVCGPVVSYLMDP
jgi:hypothetical protein